MHALDAETLAALVQDMPVAMVVYHAPTDAPAEMRLIVANRAISELLGADLSRGIGRTIGELFAASLERPEGRARIARMHHTAVHGGTSVIDPMDSGDPRLGGWYRMRNVGIGGRRVAVFFDDITAAMQQAEQLRIWSGLARSIAAGVVVAGCPADGAPLASPVIAFNPAARRIFGAPLADGRPLDAVLAGWLDAERRARLARGVSDGEPIEWHQVRGSRVYRVRIARAGDRLMLSATDDTEGARLRWALERHAELLAHSNAELEAFAHVVSHDLQAPLRSMAGFGELLARRYGGQLDEKADRFLRHITDGAGRMRALIADLLAWSRVGRDGPAPRMVELGPVMQRVEASLDDRIARTGGVLDYDALPAVWGIEFQLAQLLQNLVENGLKYHRPDVPPRVRVRAARRLHGWRLEVEDNGIGIAPERREEAFEPLRRLGGHADEGSGIGLAICRRIAQRSRGRIWIEDADGPGIRVVVELPEPERIAP